MQKQKTYTTTRAAAIAAFRKAAKEIKTLDLDKVEIVDGIEALRDVQARYVEEAA